MNKIEVCGRKKKTKFVSALLNIQNTYPVSIIYFLGLNRNINLKKEYYKGYYKACMG